MSLKHHRILHLRSPCQVKILFNWVIFHIYFKVLNTINKDCYERFIFKVSSYFKYQNNFVQLQLIYFCFPFNDSKCVCQVSLNNHWMLHLRSPCQVKIIVSIVTIAISESVKLQILHSTKTPNMVDMFATQLFKI